jgi:GT2 family glycosyltransferase
MKPGDATIAPRLVALVVTRNRLAKLQTTVDRLLAEEVDAILVVDNASTDGTAAYLRGLVNARLHVLSLKDNIGGAGGFEQGLRRVAQQFDPDWCVLMDDDARPEPGAMAQFLAQSDAMIRTGYEAIAAGVYYPDGRICDMNRPSRNPFWHGQEFVQTLFGGRTGFHVDDTLFGATSVAPIDATSFVGFFLSRQGLQRAGFPDGRLFIYADDVLYTLRLTRLGGRIGFLPTVRFSHDCATYQQGGGDIYRPLWKAYYNYRNSLLAYRAAAGPVLFWPVFVMAAVKWRLRARYAGADRPAYLALLRLALADAVLGRLTRSHAEVQRLAGHGAQD